MFWLDWGGIQYPEVVPVRPAGTCPLLDPVYFYRVQVWQAFDIGGCGSFFLASGSASGQTWYPYAQKTFDYSPCYVSATDVMAAQQSEDIMEGAQDYEYLAMLKDRIAELKKVGKKVNFYRYIAWK